MQGSKFLKVTGVLMIIFGAIAIVVDIFAMLGLGILEALGAPMGIVWSSIILALLGAVAELVAGIIGVANWNKPQNATKCIVCGIVVVAFCLISNILTLVGYSDSFSAFSLFSGLVIPVLYLVGAFQNKKLNDSFTASNYSA